jgi:hypothetical protein
MCAGVALLRLRKTEPALVRPFKIPHPSIAILFTIVSIGLAGELRVICKASLRSCGFEQRVVFIEIFFY